MAEALSPEAEQELTALREALAEHVDEEVVAAQWFRPPGWGSVLRGLGRFFKRIGGKDPQARLRAMNVMAVTPSRVVAYTLGMRTGAMRARKPVGEWALADVTVGAKAHTVTTIKHSSPPGGADPLYRQETRTDMRLVSLRGRGGQPLLLECDFPRTALTEHLVDTISRAAG